MLDIQLLSDKWRSTVALVVLTFCVAALGCAAFVVTQDIDLVLGTLGLLFVINRKPLGLDEKRLMKILERIEKKKSP